MRVILYCVFLFTFAQSAVSLTDIYFEIKEKDRLDYLNESSKNSLRNIKNTMLDENNTLHVRNSQISRMVKYYQNTSSTNRTSLSEDDITLLNGLEELSLAMADVHEEFSCDNIEENIKNDLRITKNECYALDIKLLSIYKVGIYNKQIFENSLRKNYYLDEIESLNNAGFNERIRKITIEDIKNAQMISLMNENYVLALCEKYADSTNKNFVDKEIVIQSIIRRLGQLSVVLDTDEECMTYDFSNHKATSIGSTAPVISLESIKIYLEGLISGLQVKFDKLVSDIASNISLIEVYDTNLTNALNATPPNYALAGSYLALKNELVELNNNLIAERDDIHAEKTGFEERLAGIE